jgi:hypothetical protein
MVRRLRFRRASGERLDFWALAPRGEILATEVLGREIRSERDDLSEPLREHWAATTDLFVGLAAPLLSAGTNVQALALQWISGSANPLPWTEYDQAAGKSRARLIVPDATLVLPERRLRVFVECEMGGHSVVSASDEKSGSTIRKIERYEQFLTSCCDVSARRTHYEACFADGWPAEVLFLVRSESRRDTINGALRQWRSGRQARGATVRVQTLAEAIGALQIHQPSAEPRPVGAGTKVQTAAPLAVAETALLRRFYQAALLQLRASGQELSEEFRNTARQARHVLQRFENSNASRTGDHP